MAAASLLTGGEATTGTATTTPDAEQSTSAPETKTPVEVADWRSGLTGDHASLAQEKTLANIKGKDFNEVGPTLAKMVVEGQKLIGKKTEGMIKLPGKDAKPEEIAAYREAVGIPETPADYDVKLPADAPEGMAIDPERFAGYAKVFHAMNLSNDQVNGIIGWALQEEAKKGAAQREQYAQALDGLADTWGVDVFNRRAGEVQALVRRYADPETMKWLDQSGLTNHPGLFKMLFPIAREFAESGVIEPAGESVESDLSSIETRLDDNRKAYLAEPEGSPKRATLLNERERLLNMRQELTAK
jgi:hypothetical protein